MKKNGKKWRKLQKEAEERKPQKNEASIGFSEKDNAKIKGKMCHHYHREYVSWEKGTAENRPREEWRGISRYYQGNPKDPEYPEKLKKRIAQMVEESLKQSSSRVEP